MDEKTFKEHFGKSTDPAPAAKSKKDASPLSDPHSGSYTYGSSPEADKIWRDRAKAAEAAAKKKPR